MASWWLIPITLVLFFVFLGLYLQHLKKSFQQPNDIWISIPSPFAPQWKQKSTKLSIRMRQWILPSKDNTSSNRVKLIIFLSDIGDSLDIWDDFINDCFEHLYHESCRNKYYFIAYDRSCYGQSSNNNPNKLCIAPPKLETISIEQRLQELNFIINHMLKEMNENEIDLTLVGHGYGGMLAQFCLFEQNDLCKDSLKKFDNINMILLNSNHLCQDNVFGRAFNHMTTNQVYQYLVKYSTGLYPIDEMDNVFKYPHISSSSLSRVNNIRICKFYRSMVNQIMGICGELQGYWQSIDSLSMMKNETNENDKFEKWCKVLTKENNNKVGKIGVLYCDSMFGNKGKMVNDLNQEWSLLQHEYNKFIPSQTIAFCKVINDSGHYLHIQHANKVVPLVCQMIL